MPNIFLPVKRFLKLILQNFAARFGRHTRNPVGPELLILMYHRILPDDDERASTEEPGMMVSPQTFELHMSIIKSLFQPIHLSQWLEMKNRGTKLPLRCCAVTFDDGWADNYEFAFPILQQHNMPATIYLVADMIGNNQQFWPERLAQLLTRIAREQADLWSHVSLNWIERETTSYDFSSVAPTQEQLSEIIASAKVYTDVDIHQRIDQIENQLNLSTSSPQAALLNWQQVSTMCDTGLIEIGSHTCNHIRLTDDKDIATLKHEIIDSKTSIEKFSGQKVKTFCYPNGDFTELAKSFVEQHYAGAVTTQNGWNTDTSNDFLLQRIGVHEDISNSKTKFLARLSGWM